MLEVRTDELPGTEVGVVYDRTHRIVYTLEEGYFEDDIMHARAKRELFQVVRHQWAKDGGIPLQVYAWMRLRMGLPLEVVSMVQALLHDGTNLELGSGMLPRFET